MVIYVVRQTSYFLSAIVNWLIPYLISAYKNNMVIYVVRQTSYFLLAIVNWLIPYVISA